MFSGVYQLKNAGKWQHIHTRLAIDTLSYVLSLLSIFNLFQFILFWDPTLYTVIRLAGDVTVLYELKVFLP